MFPTPFHKYISFTAASGGLKNLLSSSRVPNASKLTVDDSRIGLSGGLDAPLTAVMKKTKLGLGAAL